MIADWTVEISAESPSIDVPWAGWINLSQHFPEMPASGGSAGHVQPAADTQAHLQPVKVSNLAGNLEEPNAYPELFSMLAIANTGWALSSKVDVFPVDREDADPEIAEAGEAETLFGLGSYLDILTPHLDRYNAFPEFELLARSVTRALRQVDLPLGCAEIVIRPAHLFDSPTFAWTLYAMGFGSTEAAARACWERAAMMVVSVTTQHIAASISAGK